jgi:hypothetical protein
LAADPLHHEVDERPDLRGRMRARRVKCIKRKRLAGPVWKKIDEESVCEQILNADRFDSGDACSREAFGCLSRSGTPCD